MGEGFGFRAKAGGHFCPCSGSRLSIALHGRISSFLKPIRLAATSLARQRPLYTSRSEWRSVASLQSTLSSFLFTSFHVVLFVVGNLFFIHLPQFYRSSVSSLLRLCQFRVKR